MNPKLVIKGKTNYIHRMYKHLRKEHPSTKKRMVIVTTPKKAKKMHLKVDIWNPRFRYPG